MLSMDKILVIEDEYSIRYNLKEILTLHDFEVVLAENPQEGLFLATEKSPNLILCDIAMPTMNGYELLKTLKNNPETMDIPFIFLTAKIDRKDQRYGMELGADDYISKPFQIDELIKAIKIRLAKKAHLEKQKQQKLDELRHNIAFYLPHELQTPLNGIIGGSQLLNNYVQVLKQEDIKEISGIISNSAERLQSLIQKFWLYADLEITANNPEKINKIRQEKNQCFTTNLITNLAQNIAKKANRENDLELELTDEMINISEDSFQKVVQELVDNAFKFSETSTPIKIFNKINNSKFHLFIIDNGKGMSKQEIDQIGAYMQFDRRKYEQQGSGLGLIIVKRILELYNGNLNIKSVLGKQTVIEVILPIDN